MYRFEVAVKRYRAPQLQRLMEDPNLDLETFEREVWRISPHIWVDGRELPFTSVCNSTLPASRFAELEDALRNGRLKVQGNAMWKPGTNKFGPMLDVDDSTRLRYVHQAGRILGDTSLSPIAKARQVEGIDGLGLTAPRAW